jgi:hypothetical protein
MYAIFETFCVRIGFVQPLTNAAPILLLAGSIEDERDCCGLRAE